MSDDGGSKISTVTEAGHGSGKVKNDPNAGSTAKNYPDIRLLCKNGIRGAITTIY